MTQRENLLSLLRKTGYQYVPMEFHMCPSFSKKYNDWLDIHKNEYPDGYFTMAWDYVGTDGMTSTDISRFNKYHDSANLSNPNYYIDSFGAGHLYYPTSMHMSRFFHPLANAGGVEDILAYPLGGYSVDAHLPNVKKRVDELHERGIAATGNMQATIWETSWYIRGMENLMADMMDDGDMAAALFDMITDLAVCRAQILTLGGVDILSVGDDVGMQKSIMMSEALYCEWLKPRLAKIIREAKKINPGVIIHYHSDGYIEPFIPHLIETGVEVLNPVQPECMDFSRIYEKYGDRLSFHGTLGTQTTLPFGAPGDVKREIEKNLKIAGANGGLFPAPTHIIEPEVPVENIIAYIDACRSFKL